MLAAYSNELYLVVQKFVDQGSNVVFEDFKPELGYAKSEVRYQVRCRIVNSEPVAPSVKCNTKFGAEGSVANCRQFATELATNFQEVILGERLLAQRQSSYNSIPNRYRSW